MITFVLRAIFKQSCNILARNSLKLKLCTKRPQEDVHVKSLQIAS